METGPDGGENFTSLGLSLDRNFTRNENLTVLKTVTTDPLLGRPTPPTRLSVDCKSARGPSCEKPRGFLVHVQDHHDDLVLSC